MSQHLSAILVRYKKSESKHSMTFRSPRSFIIFGFLITLLLFIPHAGFPQNLPSKSPQAFQELFDYSLKEKKGLTFFVQGQTIPGVVIRMIGDDAIEVRNQTSNRIIIRLDRIDAVAAN